MFLGLFNNSKSKEVQKMYEKYISLTHIKLQKKEILRKIALLDKELEKLNSKERKIVVPEKEVHKGISIYI